MEEEKGLWEPLCEYVALHPLYYAVFRQSTDQLLYGDGPLPREWRHFLAIMAAARMDCEYLHEVHMAEFIRLGGDPDWLRGGLPRVPAKLRKLDELNRILAHQPWLVTRHHLTALTRTTSPDNWSLSELMHGAIILSHVHSLASFVKGCGIISSQPPSPLAVPEAVSSQSEQGASATSSLKASPRDENGIPEEEVVRPVSEVELLMERMRRLTEPASSAPNPDDVRRQFDQLLAVASSAAAAASPASPGPVRPSPSATAAPLFSEDPAFQYVDFAKRDHPQQSPTFKIHDYNWEDQGFSLVAQLYGEFAELLDRKFRLTQSLTYYTMGKNEGVNTEPFRTAIWNYIQGLFGIRHDDYDYHQVNELVRRRLKELVKTVCCYPQRTSEALRQGVMTEFLHSERVHVMLLVAEARQQSVLLYFTRAVGHFLNS